MWEKKNREEMKRSRIYGSCGYPQAGGYEGTCEKETEGRVLVLG